MLHGRNESPVRRDHDEEGLLLSYDVILCGTGLVPSILASALTRAGQSVLHCDGNDYYGEYDAGVSLAFQFPQKAQQQQQQQHQHGEEEEEEEENEEEKKLHDAFQLHPKACVRLESTETLTDVSLKVGMEVSTPYGVGHVISLPMSETDTTKSGVAIRLNEWTLANGTSSSSSSPTLYMGIQQDARERPLNHHNITPLRLLRARQLLEQQRYFALDLNPSLLFASGPAVQALLKSHVADYMDFKSLEGLLWYDGSALSRVPCSKGDVFSTTLLSPLEKRRLMKFLQLTLDYATAQQQQHQQEEGDQDSADTSESIVQSLNEIHLNQGRSLARPQNKAIATDELKLLDKHLDVPFSNYLSQHAKLSPNLIQLVVHALALEPGETLTTKQGMMQLCQHVQSLGRYGTTAFLVPMYGSGELAQSFCRSAAVHGATYLLRRAPKRVVVQDNTVQGIVLDGPDGGEKMIPCRHVVVGAHLLSSLTERSNSKRRVWRRISIVDGKLLKDYEEQRHVLIIPPGTCGNSYAIHGLVLDHSSHVTPAGCAMLHLTTTTTMMDGPGQTSGAHLLELVVPMLKVEEIHHVAFSYEIPNVSNAVRNVNGLYICRTPDQSLVLDAQVEQAKDIFQSICPDVDFLAMSEEIEKLVKERSVGRDDEEDEERMVLESAMNMRMETEEESGVSANDE